VRLSMRLIQIEAYNNTWPLLFEKEQTLLASILSIPGVSIHHIGSTAVPGLSAKPIIDILIEVEDLLNLDTVNYKFAAIGYECKGEFGIRERRFYQKGGDERSHHIHVFKSGSQGAVRHIAFKEYLKAHPSVAREYRDLKSSLVKTSNNNIELYSEGKCEFVGTHEQLALAWWHNIE